MTLILPIITLSSATLLAGAALVLAFFSRVPAAAVAFAAMIVAQLSGIVHFSAAQLWFWGIAAALATAIGYAVRSMSPRSERIYIVGGSLAGAMVGLAIGSSTAVILSSAAGAFLGFEAFRRTPGGRALAPIGLRIDAFAATALPSVVNFTMLMLIFAQLLQVK